MNTPRRLSAVGVSLALVVLATPGPGSAHEPAAHQVLNPGHFNGDGNPFGHGSDPTGESKESQVISDRFDGVNETFMFRSIASPEAKLYQWYVCTASANPYAGQCGPPAAEDTSATLTFAPPGAGQVAAFSAPFNVGVDGSVSIKGVACIEGPPARPGHCRLNTVDPVHLDDASTTSGHPATDSGEITQPLHGDPVLNAGFTAVAFTGESDIGRMFFCVDNGTSPVTPENASPATGCDPGSAADPTPDDSPACGGVPAGADCWEVTIDPPDDAEFALAVVEQDDSPVVSSGSGDCEGDSLVGGDGDDVGDDCQLDKIYLTSHPTIPSGQPQEPACPGFAGDPRNQIVGTSANDELVGSPGRDVICGLKGKDLIRGRGGKDLLLGGPGPDRLRGGPKSDRLKGGPKNDRLNGGPGRDRCQGGPGRDREVSCER